ncbi:restriction endonuclease subunit M [soil metagenome]
MSKIDISENTLRNRGKVLDILLLDRTSTTKRKQHNIIWATDSYINYGTNYYPIKQIKRDLITGTFGKVIQPRAAKSREEQVARTKDKAEVFTPLKIVKQMNLAIDWASKNYPVATNNWIDYINELRLEITCGEAPFIVGRYNPTSNTGLIISPKNRVGFFDRKLQKISEFTKSRTEWLKYAEIALKATYGYEWQGDNLIIARENILLTIDDFFNGFCKNKLKLKTKHHLTDEQLEFFAEIISWNIFQMDGLKYVAPMSCKHVTRIIPGELTLFGETPDIIDKDECEGCKFNRSTKHNGKYAKIMDWERNKPTKFINIVEIN